MDRMLGFPSNAFASFSAPSLSIKLSGRGDDITGQGFQRTEGEVRFDTRDANTVCENLALLPTPLPSATCRLSITQESLSQQTASANSTPINV